MLWKLTREGEVGMDMAWVIRARMECCSCHRWKRFLTAERTCQTGERSLSASSVVSYYMLLLFILHFLLKILNILKKKMCKFIYKSTTNGHFSIIL